MGRTFAGALLVLVAGCTTGIARESGHVVKTVPLEHVKALAYVHSMGRLHLVSDDPNQFVRLEGPRGSVEGVAIKRHGSILSIRGAARGMDVYVSVHGLGSVSLSAQGPPGHAEGGQCKLAVTGNARARLDRIVADTVQIYVDGGARLDVGNLTAAQIQSNLDGYGNVKMQRRAPGVEPRADRVGSW